MTRPRASLSERSSHAEWALGSNRTLSDWVLFALLSLLWASAYAFTRLAVSKDDPGAGFPPEFIIPARLLGASLVLLMIARASGQAWPPRSDRRSWGLMVIMGVIGTALPFLAITSAQRTVDSSLAALYVAAAPLFVGLFAHFAFQDDRMTRQKGGGIIVGFVGVAVLFGPEAVASFGSASVTAQALCLLATVFYAISTITARTARSVPPMVFAAGFVTIGAVATLPLLLAVDWPRLAPSSLAIGGVVGLAIGPTAMASILYLVLVKRTSATFLSLTGYTIPIVSAVIGFLAFGEVQTWRALLAFALILSGVWLSPRPVG
ncbi:MAG: DMT family transporter, partial [Pseudomonadota bacterium]